MAKQPPQIFNWILASRMGEFVRERAHREGVGDVVDRSIPTDPDMVGGRPVLAAHVRNRVGHVGDALLELAAAAIGHVGLEGCLDRGKHRAMKPCGRPPVRCDSSFEMLGADRVIIVMLDLVLAGPCHLDGRAELA